MQETREMWVWSLGGEDPLEERMATHSSILAWRMPWTEEPGGLQSMGSQRARHDWACTCMHNSIKSKIPEISLMKDLYKTTRLCWKKSKMTQTNGKISSHSWIGRINSVKMSILPKAIFLGFSAIFIKIQMAFFTEIEKKMPQICLEPLKAPTIKTITREKRKLRCRRVQSQLDAGIPSGGQRRQKDR